MIYKNNKFVLLGVGIAIFTWMIEVVLHTLVFRSGSFIEELHSLSNPHELWMRIVIFLL
jgi:hypothetical protein